MNTGLNQNKVGGEHHNKSCLPMSSALRLKNRSNLQSQKLAQAIRNPAAGLGKFACFGVACVIDFTCIATPQLATRVGNVRIMSCGWKHITLNLAYTKIR